ncbi:MAG: glycosyltransferase family 2 protein [Candidatus Woesearchaeota archaeon]
MLIKIRGVGTSEPYSERINMANRVTIGIPIYNEEKTLQHTLSSVESSAQKLNIAYEIILCFNGTTDNGREIAIQYQKRSDNLKIIDSIKGKSKAILKILDSAQNDEVIFCDADVIVDKNCFQHLLKNFKIPYIMAVTGSPKPINKNNLISKILNARMTYPKSEVARLPLEGCLEKPFIHGRIYALKKSILSKEDTKNKFKESIGDDTFLTHYIIKNYGRKSIIKEDKAVVNYVPVQSIKSWWDKWFRIWSDLDKIYEDNPEFRELKPFMQTKLDWNYISKLPMPTPLHFVAERVIHHAGKNYAKFIKNKRKDVWRRLGDTKTITK